MIALAKILKPCGIKGEMKCQPYVKDASFWKDLKEVEIDSKPYSVISTRFYKDFLYILLSGVSSMNDAESFVGLEIMGDENSISRSDGEYLICDLEGCEIVSESGEKLGFVDSVEKYGSADIINIKKMGAIYSFPFLKSIIKSIDVDGKLITVYKEKLDEVLV